jgi:O-antigen/teichoic acid export membrane protein
MSLEHDVEEVEVEAAGTQTALLQPAMPVPSSSTGQGSELEDKALEGKAKTGALYIALFTVLATGLRFVNSVVFTHMFLKEYFGLLTLVTTIIVGLNLFSHLGLQDSVVQNPRGDEPDFLNTAWTMQVLRGVAIFILSVLLAWPAAHFYHIPEMLWLVPLLGFGAVIAGFASPSTLSLARHLGVRQLSNLEFANQVVAFVATIVWALFSPSLWALAGGRLIAELTRTLHSYTMMRELKPRFVLDRTVVLEIVRFGRWILVGTIFNYLALQSDRLILGKLVSLDVLALYGIAYNLSDLPRQIILQFCTKVGFPFIAKFMQKSREEYTAVLLKYRAPVLIFGAFLLTLTICTGDIFIGHVFPKSYIGAAWMVAVLAAGLWHTLLYSTLIPAIMALQRSHYNAIAYAAYCVSLFIMLPVGFHLYGIVGATIGVAASDLPVYIIYLLGARHEGMHVWRQDVWVTCAFAAILASGLALRHMAGIPLPFPTRLY